MKKRLWLPIIFLYCNALCAGNGGRGTFMICRSLENVIFVNGVKKMDNYLFLGCGSLKNV